MINDNFIKTDNVITTDILIVEDEPVTRSILSSILTKIGYSVAVASNGVEGLEKFKEIVPPLIITDYNMPEMTGLEMLQQIKSFAPKTKTVLMTTYTEPEVLIKAINIGIDKFLEKPIHQDAVKQTTNEMFEYINISKEYELQQNLLNAYRKGVDTNTIFSILDNKGNYTYVNANLCDISGYSQSELIGNSPSILNKKTQTQSKCQTNIDTNLTTCNSISKYTSKNGDAFITETTTIPIYQNNKLTNFIAIEKNIGDVVNNYKKNMQNIIDADSALIITFNDDFDLISCNIAYANFFGFKTNQEALEQQACFCTYLVDREGFLYSDFTKVTCDSSKLKCFFDLFQINPNGKMLIESPVNKDEHIFTMTYSQLSQDFIGLDRRHIVRLHDITELDNLKNEEMQQVMLASIGKLAAGITHEINTPLTYIRGNFELLQMDIEDSLQDELKDDFNEYSVSILDGVQRIATIVESMREIFGESTVERSSVNLYKTLVVACKMIYNSSKQVATIFLNGKILNLDTNPEEEQFVANIIPRQIEQVWIIIINNAIDQLSSTNQSFEDKTININISKLGDRHKVTIADTGGGIDDKIISKLFMPFASTKNHSGMGLGLNIAKNIIERHNGLITASNNKKGAVFEIIL
jgi:PAS domain S-box-containing protein